VCCRIFQHLRIQPQPILQYAPRTNSLRQIYAALRASACAGVPTIARSHKAAGILSRAMTLNWSTSELVKFRPAQQLFICSTHPRIHLPPPSHISENGFSSAIDWCLPRCRSSADYRLQWPPLLLQQDHCRDLRRASQRTTLTMPIAVAEGDLRQQAPW
jgi:hypothetical protein